MRAINAREGAVEATYDLYGALSRAAGQQEQGGRVAAPVQRGYDGHFQVD